MMKVRLSFQMIPSSELQNEFKDSLTKLEQDHLKKFFLFI